jgi:hypothetical protein
MLNGFLMPGAGNHPGIGFLTPVCFVFWSHSKKQLDVVTRGSFSVPSQPRIKMSFIRFMKDKTEAITGPKCPSSAP